ALWCVAKASVARPAAPAPMTTTSVERFHSIRGLPWADIGRDALRPHLDEAGHGVKTVSTRRRPALISRHGRTDRRNRRPPRRDRAPRRPYRAARGQAGQ